MQANEIPDHVGKIVGYRRHNQQILPESAYLLSERIYGAYRDAVRQCMAYVVSESRQTPEKAKGRMSWSFGWPIIELTTATGPQAIEAHRFLDQCHLQPNGLFARDSRGILTVIPGTLPPGLTVGIVHDPRMLIAPTGKNLSGAAAE